MERPSLRPPYPAESVDPLTLTPDPAEMGRLYIDVRGEKYPDGMFLALATPKRPYGDIIADYVTHKDDADFSPIGFWEANFNTPHPSSSDFAAVPGQSIKEYIRSLRPFFVQPVGQPNDPNNPKLWTPYPGLMAGIGGRFDGCFMWDGYMMLKGRAADGDWQTVLNVVDNTEYQINTVGYPVNGDMFPLTSRPHPPFFSNEVSMLADEYGDEALIRYLPAMEKELTGFWMAGREELALRPDDGHVHRIGPLVRLPLGDGQFAYLNRYWDGLDTPRLESYQEDVELGQKVTHGLEAHEKAARLSKLFRSLRAAAASGWDFSTRWFEDANTLETINTIDIIPIDLNALLARAEQVIARAYLARSRQSGLSDATREADRQKAFTYATMAGCRTTAMRRFHWDPYTRIFRDYNWRRQEQTPVISSAMTFPLYVGITDIEQTFGVADSIQKYGLLQSGGLATTTAKDSREQWDGNDVWAPPNWAGARGMARMAFLLQTADAGIDVTPLLELAQKIRHNYKQGVQAVFDEHHVVPEKHNGTELGKMGAGGEYDVVKLLGMSAEMFMAMDAWEPDDPHGTLPIGPLILPGR